MHIINHSLYHALKEYVSAAVTFLAQRAHQASPSSDLKTLEFYWIHALYSSDLSELPEYGNCAMELQDDSKIGSHLDRNVGSHSRGAHAPSVQNMMKRVLDLGRRERQFEFDQIRFDTMYPFFELTFHSETLLCEAIAPLQGLLLITPVIALSPTVEICQLDPEEMRPYVQDISRWDNRWSAVRVRYEVPKIIATDSGDRFETMSSETRWEEIQKEQRIEEDVNRLIEDVVNTLRLFGKCDVYHSGVIHESSKWLSIHSH